MVFRAGQRDPARGMLREFRKAGKGTSRKRVYFPIFRKSSNIPSARITLSCTENHLVFALYNNYSETTEKLFKISDQTCNSHNNCHSTNQRQQSLISFKTTSWTILIVKCTTTFKQFVFEYNARNFENSSSLLFIKVIKLTLNIFQWNNC